MIYYIYIILGIKKYIRINKFNVKYLHKKYIQHNINYGANENMRTVTYV